MAQPASTRVRLLLPVPHKWRDRRPRRTAHPRARTQKVLLALPAILLALLIQAWFVRELLRASELPPEKPLLPTTTEPEVILDLLLQPDPVAGDGSQAANPARPPSAAAAARAQNPSAARPAASMPARPIAAQPASAEARRTKVPTERLVLRTETSKVPLSEPRPPENPMVRVTSPARVPETSVLTVTANIPVAQAQPLAVSAPPTASPATPEMSVAPRLLLSPEVQPVERSTVQRISPALRAPATPQVDQAVVPRPARPTLASERTVLMVEPELSIEDGEPISVRPPRPAAPTSGLLAPEIERMSPPELSTTQAPTPMLTPPERPALAANTRILLPQRETTERPPIAPPPDLRAGPHDAPLSPRPVPVTSGLVQPELAQQRVETVSQPDHPSIERRAPALPTTALPAANTGLLQVDRAPASAPVPDRQSFTATITPTAPAVGELAPVTRGLLEIDANAESAQVDPSLLATDSAQSARQAPSVSRPDAAIVDTEEGSEAPAKANPAPPSSASFADDDFGPARATGPATAADLLSGISDAARDQVAADAAANRRPGSPFNRGVDPYFGELPNRLAGLRLSQPEGFREVLDFLSSTLREGGLTYRDQQWTDGAEMLKFNTADAIEDGMSVLLERWIDKHHGSLRKACTDNLSQMSDTVHHLLCDEGAAMEFERQQQRDQ